MILRRPAIVAVSLLILSFPLSAQMLAWDSSNLAALEEFRLGVQSFQRGFFNESILSLEKALSAKPEDPLIISWLARSYYRSGLDLTAAEQWQRILDRGIVSPYVSGRIEFLKSARTMAGTEASREKLIESGRITNKAGQTKTFLRPTWISPDTDGSFWLTAFGSDELLKFDVNGVILIRLKGPIGGLDRPFCAIKKEGGGFFVSEYGLDSIAILREDGSLVKRFGGKGRGNGKLLGPQYLCQDQDGYLYVSDYGNRRISKFDPDGQFVLSFGAAQLGFPDFPGLSAPTGIACSGEMVYVADAFRKAIFAFDRDGNFKQVLVAEGLEKPEGLTVYMGNSLLVADQGRLLSIDRYIQETTVLYSGQEKENRILSAALDANGNVIACDFDLSAISVLSPESSVYSGFNVNVLRVNAERFPQIDAELLVQDNRSRPISGLNAKNFYVTEQIPSIEQRKEGEQTVSYETYTARSVPSFELLQSMSSAPGLDTVIVMDPTQALKSEVRVSSDTLLAAFEAMGEHGQLSYVHSGKIPSFDGPLEPGLILKNYAKQTAVADFRLDLGLRLAASKLVVSDTRRAIFYVSSGAIGDASFKGYSLTETAAYLANNNIVFYVLMLGRGSPDPSLEYLAAQTGGQIVALSRPKGVADLMDALAKRPYGRYVIRFTSQAESDFGRSYLPFAVEAYLMKKSGRDEFGFFAPLK
jgi:DNA-binding beta-propeller fold protein YncE